MGHGSDDEDDRGALGSDDEDDEARLESDDVTVVDSAAD